MAIRTKPDMSEVWAQTGVTEDPRTQYGDVDKIKDGWVQEIPLFESENYMRNRADQMLAHLNDYGIAVWDSVSEYPNKAWSRSSVDGEVYVSIQAVPAGEDDPSLEPTYWKLFQPLSETSGTLLRTPYDMTNSGADDLNNIDITWLTAWDAYDYVEIVIEDCEASNDGQMAFALSSDGGSSWETFVGGAKEAMGWSNTEAGVGDVFSGVMRMDLNAHGKTPYCSRFSPSNKQFNASGDFFQGYAFGYSGTTLNSAVAVGNFDTWDTGSNGLDTYTLRFTHEVGNFTSGTLKLIGYKYP